MALKKNGGKKISSKSFEKKSWGKNISYIKKIPWYMLNMGQNKLWLEAHSYK